MKITPTHRTTQKIELKEGEPIKVKQSTEEIETPISQFNKKQMCDYIINNGQYATQKLLKIAISYRFAHSHYSGNPDVKRLWKNIDYFALKSTWPRGFLNGKFPRLILFQGGV